jgi:hypothetical protein
MGIPQGTAGVDDFLNIAHVSPRIPFEHPPSIPPNILLSVL